ncbi:MAG: response regulator transcription factor [Ginsengibacter sp.]
MEGFDLEVIDYLLKPVPLPRFLKAAQKAKDLLDNDSTPKSPYDGNEFIMVKGDNKGKLMKIEMEEIDYIGGTGNYVTIYCGAKKILSLINMKDLEMKLPRQKFIRVHKSFIIAVSKISSIDSNLMILKNHPKAEIMIGKVYKAAVLERLKSRLIS